MVRTLQRTQFIPAPRKEVWDFFATPHNLNALTPPALQFNIQGNPGPMHAGQLIAYRIRLAPGVRVSWLTEIRQVEAPHRFVDEQRAGPYRFWSHEHTFTAVDGGTHMADRVTYIMPFEPLGSLVHKLWVGRQLRTIFDFRATAVARRWPGT